MPSKKSNIETSNETKPKRTLNPIIKAMNDYRNNVISEHVGSKAPKKTSPVFKVTLAAARTEMGLDDKDKNTIEVVNKAQSIFEANVSKYLKMAEVAQEEEAKNKPKKETKKKVVEKETKTATKSKKKEVVEDEPKSATKSKKKEVVEEETKTATKSKKKPVKESKKKEVVKEVVVDSDSDSDSDSDHSESDSDSD